MSNSGKKDKGKHEPQKKAAHTLKEKRRLKREKKNPHPEEIVGKLHQAEKAVRTPVAHG